MAKPWEKDRIVPPEEAQEVIGYVPGQEEAAPADGEPWQQDAVVAAAPTGAAQPGDSNMGLFNRNILDALMGPVDLAAMPNRAIHSGIDWLRGVERTPEDQALVDQTPSDLSKSLLGAISTPIASEDYTPTTLTGEAAGGAGTALGMLPAILVGSGVAAGYQGPGQGAVNAVGNMVGASTNTAPKLAATAGWEALSGAAMPYGRDAGERIAQDQGWNEEIGGAIGEVLGGVAAPALGSAAIGTAKTGAGLAGNGVFAPLVQAGKRLLNPMDAAFTRASGAVRSKVADPEATARLVEDAGLSNMTPGMRTGSDALMQHERSIIASDPGLRERFRVREQEGMDEIRQYLSGMSNGGSVSKAKDAAAQYAQIAQNQIDQSVETALRNAEAAVQRASSRSGADPETISQTFMDELEGARLAAREVERAAWDMVPKDIKAVPQNVKHTFDAIVAERGAEGKRSIDPYFKQIIDGEWKEDPSRTVQQISTFRSEALRSAREARARGDHLTAAVSDRMAEAARVDLDGIDGAGPALDAARKISTDYHDRFTRGEIGKLLQYEPGGAMRVDPQMALRRLIGNKTGEALSSATTAVDRAFGTPNDPLNPGTLLVDDYMRTSFGSAIRTPDGYNPTRGEVWLGSRKTALSRYPALESVVDKAVGSTKAHASAVRKAQADEKALAHSPSVVFKESPVHREFDDILNKTKDPRATMQELVSATRIVPDPEGAVNGLRRASTDYLLRGANKHITSRGEIVQGQKFSTMLTDPRTREALEVLYTPDQMSVLDDIASNLTRWDMMHNRTTNSGGALVPPDLVDTVVNNVAGYLGVRAGGALGRYGGGSGSIQLPGKGSRLFTVIAERMNASGAEKLLRDAVEDPELYRELLRGRRGPDPNSGFQLDAASSPRLVGWLAAASSEYFHGDKETPDDAWDDAVSTVGGVLTR